MPEEGTGLSGSEPASPRARFLAVFKSLGMTDGWQIAAARIGDLHYRPSHRRDGFTVDIDEAIDAVEMIRVCHNDFQGYCKTSTLGTPSYRLIG